MSGEKKGRKSERPVPELKKERDSFIHSFFKKGAQFTQDLVNENNRLRTRLSEVEAEGAQLRAQVKSDDAIRELLKKIDALEREKMGLLSQYQQVEAASNRVVGQYTEIESELANLANLYVASYQLHASLSFRATVRQMKELLEQLVGARTFAVYLATSDGKFLSPVVAEGIGKPGSIPIKADDGGIGETFCTAVGRIEGGELHQGSFENPVALVPMKVEDKVIGVLVIFTTLAQKTRFLQVDIELFKLFGAHAGTALVCARLFSDGDHRIPSFDGFFEIDM
jgi:hypothetical protein